MTAPSYVTLPHHLSSAKDGGESVIRIPHSAHSLKGFREWVHSADVPEKVKVHFIEGEVHVDMSNEAIQSHVLVKVGVFSTLIQLMRLEDLGQFYTDGVLVTNEEADVSNNPDGVAVLWESFEADRVRYVSTNGKDREIQGSPDWLMEIVSDSSVTKDKKKLRRCYHAAKVSEYWLIDARGEEISFQILLWRRAGYVAAPIKDGWQHSRIFKHDFRLSRKRNRAGDWDYTLEIKQ